MTQIRNAVRRAWRSSTVATWLAFLTTSVNGVVVLPFVVSTFTAAEVAVWLLLLTINGFQVLFDAGFTPTFTRFVSYLSTAEPDVKRLRKAGFVDFVATQQDEIRSGLLVALKKTFLLISLIGVAFLVIVGPFVVRRQVFELDSPVLGFATLALLLPTWFFEMNGRRYIAFVEGTGGVALVRRWRAGFGALTVVSNILVVVYGGGLFVLALSSQFWKWWNVLFNRYLYARRGGSTTSGAWTSYAGSSDLTRHVTRVVWSRGWRSGLGVAFGYGTVYVTGLMYAQWGDPASVASYLIALRLFDIAKSIAQAPFYSLLPVFSREYAAGRITNLVRLIKKRIRIVVLLFGLGVSVLALFGEWGLSALGSSTPFPARNIWLVLSVAFLLERFGAMHLQSYTVTNHVVWHQVNAAHGIVALSLSFVLAAKFGALGFALALMIANMVVYAPWSTWLNMRLLGSREVLETLVYLLPAILLIGVAYVLQGSL